MRLVQLAQGDVMPGGGVGPYVPVPADVHAVRWDLDIDHVVRPPERGTKPGTVLRTHRPGSGNCRGTERGAGSPC